MVEDQPSRCSDDPPEHESPDASCDQRRHHHDRQACRLGPDIDRGEPPQRDASGYCEQLGGVEARQDRRESNHRNQPSERGLLTIGELAELICDVIGFDGELVWDKTKPDGTPRKLLDVTRIRALGWEPTIPLREGIAQTYEWFLANWARR